MGAHRRSRSRQHPNVAREASPRDGGDRLVGGRSAVWRRAVPHIPNVGMCALLGGRLARRPQPRPDAALQAELQQRERAERHLRDPPALLSECSMAHALCTMSDTTRQKILTCSSRPGVRMRVCLGILWSISIPHLRGTARRGRGTGCWRRTRCACPPARRPRAFSSSL